MRVTLVLLASACGKLVWKELLDFLLWHSLTTERCVTSRLRGCHSVSILSFKTTSRSMVKGNMAVKPRRKRHPRSLEHALPTTFISTTLSSIHSPSTRAPLQPPSWVAITMSVRDVVHKLQSIREV